MDAQSYTAQERRAANQVWAAAGAYGFEPLFLARYTDGTTDFYMNTVVGLIHKYYGDALIRSVFDAWDGDLRQTMLDDMTWLYLENAAYRLELPRRPVLEALRHAHADYFFAIQYKLSRQEWMAKNQLVYTMQAARWRRVLGRTDPVMTPYESGLAAALAFLQNGPRFREAENGVFYLAHCAARTGTYLSRAAHIPAGQPLAYLIAPPVPALLGLDAALKAAGVELAEFYAPPTETNFAGALLTGTRSACLAACTAFAEAVCEAAARPLEAEGTRRNDHGI